MQTDRIYELISDYVNSDIIPMHMPGHKRADIDYLKNLSNKLDITEINGFDDLHSANGIIKRSMENASSVFSAFKSYYLVNGSTCGITAAMYTLCKRNSKIIIARNCHKSVYNAVELLDLEPVYLYPAFDERFNLYSAVKCEDLSELIDSYPEVNTVVLTSPSYEGICSDIESIVKLCHENGINVIVDSAHGAHFGFNGGFPESAVKSGADIVIQSLHKTLPSITGTAIAHISQNVNHIAFEHALSCFETSSPSYLMLSSIDGCVNWLQSDGRSYISAWSDNLDNMHNKLKFLKNLSVLSQNSISSAFAVDKSKIYIDCSAANINGKQLSCLLRDKYRIECEMFTNNGVLLMTSPLDSSADLKKVVDALLEIDKGLSRSETQYSRSFYKAAVKYKPSDLLFCDKQVITLDKSVGCICAEYIIPYPPGIPLIVPGELITRECVDYFNIGRKNGINIIMSDPEKRNITVVKNKLIK